MKNTNSAVLYGIAGGGLGYGIAHVAKAKKKWTIALVLIGAVVGGVIGNNS